MSKTNFDSIVKGEKLSFTTYVTVNEIDKKRNALTVTSEKGVQMLIQGLDLIEGFNSNAQYFETKELGKNALAEKLQTAGDKIFTVEYIKADGSNRTLVGHLVSSESNLGRSMVRDLNITEGNNLRQVDHRTIQSLIIGGIQYVAANQEVKILTKKEAPLKQTAVVDEEVSSLCKASGRLPKWANTPLKKNYVINARATGQEYSETLWKKAK